MPLEGLSLVLAAPALESGSGGHPNYLIPVCLMPANRPAEAVPSQKLISV